MKEIPIQQGATKNINSQYSTMYIRTNINQNHIRVHSFS